MKINIWKKITLTCTDWFVARNFRDETRSNPAKISLTRAKVGLQKIHLNLVKDLLLQMI